ncbi:hypothetical protein VT84_36400 [Gemmata sp. SH-PL17]|uniref:hypothetical protein n=1 Tax=Gemmata sp. SH-PL17 TaxID=1630693 RepID=UPI00078E0762|nr:hypothetical protein [Gemmata sp. SH-PL17]AMV29932.1 hypothetical protein VT84_36400 [Gemmata sp. SH-PL17]
MKASHAAIVTALIFASALLIGCQQLAPPTTAPREKETDIRIRAPGIDVDVKGRGDGVGKDRKVDVDVNRKDR